MLTTLSDTPCCRHTVSLRGQKGGTHLHLFQLELFQLSQTDGFEHTGKILKYCAHFSFQQVGIDGVQQRKNAIQVWPDHEIELLLGKSPQGGLYDAEGRCHWSVVTAQILGRMSSTAQVPKDSCWCALYLHRQDGVKKNLIYYIEKVFLFS